MNRAKRILLHPATITGLIVLVWWVIKSWPVMSDPSDIQPAGAGDGWFGTALWRQTVAEHLNPFAPGVIESYNAPTGKPVPWQVNLQGWVSTIFYYYGTVIVGDADFVQNMYILVGYVTAGAAMGWLIWRFVVRDRWIAVLMGVLLATAPMMVAKGPGHSAFIWVGPIIVSLGLVLLFLEKPSIWRGVAAGAMAFVAVSVTGYFLLLGSVAFGTVLVGGVLANLRNPQRGRIIVAGAAAGFTFLGLVGGLTALLVIIGDGNPIDGVRGNDIIALTIYGARWYEYVIPTPGSVIFGSTTMPWLYKHQHQSNDSETALYLGITLLLVALAGTYALLRKKQPTAAIGDDLVVADADHETDADADADADGGVAEETDADADGGVADEPWRPASRGTLIVLGPILVLMAIIWSLPPHIYPLGLQIPTPSRFAFEVTTSWRVYSRFVLIVMIGLIVCVAIGVNWIGGQTRGRRRTLVLIAATIVFPVDLLTRAHIQARANPQPVDAKIAALPPGNMAVYPLGRGESDGFTVFYEVDRWNRNIVNGFDDLPEMNRQQIIGNLADPATPDRLGALGVRYIMVLDRKLDVTDPPYKIPKKLSKRFKPLFTSQFGAWPATVYEVLGGKGKVLAMSGDGFGGLEGPPGLEVAWSLDQRGAYDVWGNCETVCKGAIKTKVLSFGPKPRTVTATVDDKPVSGTVGGRPFTGKFTVQPGPGEELRIPLQFQEHEHVKLTFGPGPTPVSEAIPGNPDPRSLSLGTGVVEWAPEKK